MLSGLLLSQAMSRVPSSRQFSSGLGFPLGLLLPWCLAKLTVFPFVKQVVSRCAFVFSNKKYTKTLLRQTSAGMSSTFSSAGLAVPLHSFWSPPQITRGPEGALLFDTVRNALLEGVVEARSYAMDYKRAESAPPVLRSRLHAAPAPERLVSQPEVLPGGVSHDSVTPSAVGLHCSVNAFQLVATDLYPDYGAAIPLGCRKQFPSMGSGHDQRVTGPPPLDFARLIPSLPGVGARIKKKGSGGSRDSYLRQRDLPQVTVAIASVRPPCVRMVEVSKDDRTRRSCVQRLDQEGARASRGCSLRPAHKRELYVSAFPNFSKFLVLDDDGELGREEEVRMQLRSELTTSNAKKRLRKTKRRPQASIGAFTNDKWIRQLLFEEAQGGRTTTGKAGGDAEKDTSRERLASIIEGRGVCFYDCEAGYIKVGRNAAKEALRGGLGRRYAERKPRIKSMKVESNCLYEAIAAQVKLPVAEVMKLCDNFSGEADEHDLCIAAQAMQCVFHLDYGKGRYLRVYPRIHEQNGGGNFKVLFFGMTADGRHVDVMAGRPRKKNPDTRKLIRQSGRIRSSMQRGAGEIHLAGNHSRSNRRRAPSGAVLRSSRCEFKNVTEKQFLNFLITISENGRVESSCINKRDTNDQTVCFEWGAAPGATVTCRWWPTGSLSMQGDAGGAADAFDSFIQQGYCGSQKAHFKIWKGGRYAADKVMERSRSRKRAGGKQDVTSPTRDRHRRREQQHASSDDDVGGLLSRPREPARRKVDWAKDDVSYGSIDSAGPTASRTPKIVPQSSQALDQRAAAAGGRWSRSQAYSDRSIPLNHVVSKAGLHKKTMAGEDLRTDSRKRCSSDMRNQERQGAAGRTPERQHSGGWSQRLVAPRPREEDLWPPAAAARRLEGHPPIKEVGWSLERPTLKLKVACQSKVANPVRDGGPAIGSSSSSCREEDAAERGLAEQRRLQRSKWSIDESSSESWSAPKKCAAGASQHRRSCKDLFEDYEVYSSPEKMEVAPESCDFLHDEINQVMLLKCKNCQELFVDREEFSAHGCGSTREAGETKNHTDADNWYERETEPKFVCVACQRAFPDIEILHRHFRESELHKRNTAARVGKGGQPGAASGAASVLALKGKRQAGKAKKRSGIDLELDLYSESSSSPVKSPARKKKAGISPRQRSKKESAQIAGGASTAAQGRDSLGEAKVGAPLRSWSKNSLYDLLISDAEAIMHSVRDRDQRNSLAQLLDKDASSRPGSDDQDNHEGEAGGNSSSRALQLAARMSLCRAVWLRTEGEEKNMNVLKSLKELVEEGEVEGALFVPYDQDAPCPGTDRPALKSLVRTERTGRPGAQLAPWSVRFDEKLLPAYGVAITQVILKISLGSKQAAEISRCVTELTSGTTADKDLSHSKVRRVMNLIRMLEIEQADRIGYHQGGSGRELAAGLRAGTWGFGIEKHCWIGKKTASWLCELAEEVKQGRRIPCQLEVHRSKEQSSEVVREQHTRWVDELARQHLRPHVLEGSGVAMLAINRKAVISMPFFTEKELEEDEELKRLVGNKASIWLPKKDKTRVVGNLRQHDFSTASVVNFSLRAGTERSHLQDGVERFAECNQLQVVPNPPGTGKAQPDGAYAIKFRLVHVDVADTAVKITKRMHERVAERYAQRGKLRRDTTRLLFDVDAHEMDDHLRERAKAAMGGTLHKETITTVHDHGSINVRKRPCCLFSDADMKSEALERLKKIFAKSANLLAEDHPRGVRILTKARREAQEKEERCAESCTHIIVAERLGKDKLALVDTMIEKVSGGRKQDMKRFRAKTSATLPSQEWCQVWRWECDDDISRTQDLIGADVSEFGLAACRKGGSGLIWPRSVLVDTQDNIGIYKKRHEDWHKRLKEAAAIASEKRHITRTSRTQIEAAGAPGARSQAKPKVREAARVAGVLKLKGVSTSPERSKGQGAMTAGGRDELGSKGSATTGEMQKLLDWVLEKSIKKDVKLESLSKAQDEVFRSFYMLMEKAPPGAGARVLLEKAKSRVNEITDKRRVLATLAAELRKGEQEFKKKLNASSKRPASDVLGGSPCDQGGSTNAATVGGGFKATSHLPVKGDSESAGKGRSAGVVPRADVVAAEKLVPVVVPRKSPRDTEVHATSGRPADEGIRAPAAKTRKVCGGGRRVDGDAVLMDEVDRATSPGTLKRDLVTQAPSEEMPTGQQRGEVASDRDAALAEDGWTLPTVKGARLDENKALKGDLIGFVGLVCRADGEEVRCKSSGEARKLLMSFICNQVRHGDSVAFYELSKSAELIMVDSSGSAGCLRSSRVSYFPAFFVGSPPDNVHRGDMYELTTSSEADRAKARVKLLHVVTHLKNSKSKKAAERRELSKVFCGHQEKEARLPRYTVLLEGNIQGRWTVKDNRDGTRRTMEQNMDNLRLLLSGGECGDGGAQAGGPGPQEHVAASGILEECDDEEAQTVGRERTVVANRYTLHFNMNGWGANSGKLEDAYDEALKRNADFDEESGFWIILHLNETHMRNLEEELPRIAGSDARPREIADEGGFLGAAKLLAASDDREFGAPAIGGAALILCQPAELGWAMPTARSSFARTVTTKPSVNRLTGRRHEGESGRAGDDGVQEEVLLQDRFTKEDFVMWFCSVVVGDECHITFYIRPNLKPNATDAEVSYVASQLAEAVAAAKAARRLATRVHLTADINAKHDSSSRGEFLASLQERGRQAAWARFGQIIRSFLDEITEGLEPRIVGPTYQDRTTPDMFWSGGGYVGIEECKLLRWSAGGDLGPIGQASDHAMIAVREQLEVRDHLQRLQDVATGVPSLIVNVSWKWKDWWKHIWNWKSPQANTSGWMLPGEARRLIFGRFDDFELLPTNACPGPKTAVVPEFEIYKGYKMHIKLDRDDAPEAGKLQQVYAECSSQLLQTQSFTEFEEVLAEALVGCDLAEQAGASSKIPASYKKREDKNKDEKGGSGVSAVARARKVFEGKAKGSPVSRYSGMLVDGFRMSSELQAVRNVVRYFYEKPDLIKEQAGWVSIGSKALEGSSYKRFLESLLRVAKICKPIHVPGHRIKRQLDKLNENLRGPAGVRGFIYKGMREEHARHLAKLIEKQYEDLQSCDRAEELASRQDKNEGICLACGIAKGERVATVNKLRITQSEQVPSRIAQAEQTDVAITLAKTKLIGDIAKGGCPGINLLTTATRREAARKSLIPAGRPAEELQRVMIASISFDMRAMFDTLTGWVLITTQILLGMHPGHLLKLLMLHQSRKIYFRVDGYTLRVKGHRGGLQGTHDALLAGLLVPLPWLQLVRRALASARDGTGQLSAQCLDTAAVSVERELQELKTKFEEAILNYGEDSVHKSYRKTAQLDAPVVEEPHDASKVGGQEACDAVTACIDDTEIRFAFTRQDLQSGLFRRLVALISRIIEHLCETAELFLAVEKCEAVVVNCASTGEEGASSLSKEETTEIRRSLTVFGKEFKLKAALKLFGFPIAEDIATQYCKQIRSAMFLARGICVEAWKGRATASHFTSVPQWVTFAKIRHLLAALTQVSEETATAVMEAAALVCLEMIGVSNSLFSKLQDAVERRAGQRVSAADFFFGFFARTPIREAVERTARKAVAKEACALGYIASNAMDSALTGLDIEEQRRRKKLWSNKELRIAALPRRSKCELLETVGKLPAISYDKQNQTEQNSLSIIIAKIGRAAVRYGKTASGKWKMEEKLVVSLPDEDVYPRIGRAIQVGYQVAAGRLLETSVSRENVSIAVYSWSKGAEDENGLVSEATAKAITTVCAERIAFLAQKEPAAQVLQLARSEVETTWKTHDEIYPPAWDDEVFIQEDEEEKFQMWHELLSKELAPLPEPKEGDARTSIKKLKGAMKERLEDWIRKQNDEEWRLRGSDERDAGVAALGN
ncbi:unnamed protein product [Amoebophrya sp. A120]|nr:unnamed protein product [Amoebophrya sp. A120]|eukprot:GSA120T00010994001.1